MSCDPSQQNAYTGRLTAHMFCSFFEAMGPMLHRGIAHVGLLDELLTASVFEAWNKCAPFVDGECERTHMPQNYQWFEYFRAPSTGI
jgi:hypothetical protein